MQFADRIRLPVDPGREIGPVFHAPAEQLAGEIEISAVIQHHQSLKRDAMRLNRHGALAPCLSMIFSENRFTLFRIML
jgi:hypothetical protein